MTFIQRRINVDATSWRCIDVDATLFQRCVPAEFILSTFREPRSGVIKIVIYSSKIQKICEMSIKLFEVTLNKWLINFIWKIYFF